jgi:hypothetical protein
MLVEAATFILAALIHSGVLLAGYEHHEARIAESVIAIVLIAGLAATWLWPARATRTAMIAQAFALLGTLVGIFTIVIGVGPRTVADIAYHLAIVVVLVLGLVIAKRA